MNRAGEPIAVCVDCGSTNSLVSISYRDKIDVLSLSQWAPELTKSDYALSVVGVELDRSQNTHRYVIERAGLDAIQSYRNVTDIECASCHIWHLNLCDDQYHSCPSARLIHGIKQSLTTHVGTNVYGEIWDVDDFARILAEHLIEAASTATGGAPLEHIVVGYPVVFPGSNGSDADNDAARERLFAVFERITGLPKECIHMTPEPDAALYAERTRQSGIGAGGPVVAVDFGGGTFDVSVSTHASSPYKPEHRGGVPIGGDTLDSRIFEHLVAPLLDIKPRDAKGWTRMRMLRLAGNHMRNHPRPLSPEFAAVLESGRVFRLWEAIESAKKSLSQNDETEFRFVYNDPKNGAQVLTRPVSRQEFESWIADDMEVVFDSLDRTLKAAGIAPDDVETVLLTGGSSAVPAFHRRIENLFSRATIQDREPFTTIAYGLAEWARENIGGLEPGSLVAATEEDELGLRLDGGEPEAEEVVLFTDDEPDAATEAAQTPDDSAAQVFAPDELSWLDGLSRGTPPSRVLEMNPLLNYESLFRAARRALSLAAEPSKHDVQAEPARKGLAWSRDELGVIAWLHGIGTDVRLIAAAVQRSPRAVLFELVKMGMLPESALDDAS